MIRCAKLAAVRGRVSSISSGCVPGQTDPIAVSLRIESEGREPAYIEAVLKPTRIAQKAPGEVRAVRELFCAAVLRAYGLPVPEPFVVSEYLLPPVRLSRDSAIVAEIVSAPIHFASEWIPAAKEYQPGDFIRHEDLEGPAQDLYIADNLILNADRTTAKPNLWYRARQLIPIDHGLAFGLLNENAAAVSLPWQDQRRHFTFKTLHERELTDFTRPLNQWLENVTREIVQQIADAIPANLATAHGELARIVRHCTMHAVRVDAVTHGVSLCFKFTSPP